MKKKKKWYKIILQRDFFETCNIKPSVDIKILSPGGCLRLPRGYIHVLNHKKKCIKSDFKDIFSSPEQSSWRAIVLTPASALTLAVGFALALALASTNVKVLRLSF